MSASETARNIALSPRAPQDFIDSRRYTGGAHVIVYRDQETILTIVRILHQRMSLPRHV